MNPCAAHSFGFLFAIVLPVDMKKYSDLRLHTGRSTHEISCPWTEWWGVVERTKEVNDLPPNIFVSRDNYIHLVQRISGIQMVEVFRYEWPFLKNERRR